MKLIFRNINWKLFLSLFLASLIPTIYKTFRFYFIGTISGENNFNIASSLSWVNLFYEVIQEAILIPIFFMISMDKNKYNKESDNLENKLKIGLITTLFLYLLASFIIIIFARNLSILMNVKEENLLQTIKYIRIESFSFLFVIVYKVLVSFIIYLENKKEIIILSITEAILYMLLDLFFVGSHKFSLQIGVMGIPVSNIITNLIIITVVILLLKIKYELNIFSKENWQCFWIKKWLWKASLIGLESAIRNLVFAFMVVRIANSVTDSGTYWIANSFIWNWLLLPTLVLSELIKTEISKEENSSNIKLKIKGFFFMTIIFAALWLITIPGWNIFINRVMNFKESDIVTFIALVQTPFYLTFIFNSIMDSVFQSKGKNVYLIIQSLIINIGYYGIAFILFKLNLLQMNLLNLCLMFGIGMSLDLLPTAIQFVIFWKKDFKEKSAKWNIKKEA